MESIHMYKLPVMHGDVDIIPNYTIDLTNAKEQKDNLVMHGENGHEHRLINGQILIMKGNRYIKSGSNTFLVHEEHRKTKIPEGIFQIKQETEFDPFEDTIRLVRD